MRARSTRPVASVRERVILANAQHWSGSIESVMTRRAATIASPGDARPLLTISRVHCIRPYNISTIWNLCTSWATQAMEYTKLGRTGLDVSRICLGCMSYGGGNLGNHAWSLPEEESRPFIKKALEAGINFFDTANRYSLGNSEEILGRAIKDFARRDEVVIATKVYGRMRPGPNGAGLSRKRSLPRSTTACVGSVW